METKQALILEGASQTLHKHGTAHKIHECEQCWPMGDRLLRTCLHSVGTDEGHQAQTRANVGS